MDGMGDMGGMMGSASPAPAHDHSAHDKWVGVHVAVAARHCRLFCTSSRCSADSDSLPPTLLGLPASQRRRYHNSVERLPDGSYRYTHGAWLGHMVPGCFFLVGSGVNRFSMGTCFLRVILAETGGQAGGVRPGVCAAVAACFCRFCRCAADQTVLALLLPTAGMGRVVGPHAVRPLRALPGDQAPVLHPSLVTAAVWDAAPARRAVRTVCQSASAAVWRAGRCGVMGGGKEGLWKVGCCT